MIRPKDEPGRPFGRRQGQKSSAELAAMPLLMSLTFTVVNLLVPRSGTSVRRGLTYGLDRRQQLDSTH